MPDLLHKIGILYFNIKNQYNSVLYLSISGRYYCYFIKFHTINVDDINNSIAYIRGILNFRLFFNHRTDKDYFLNSSRLKSSWLVALNVPF